MARKTTAKKTTARKTTAKRKTRKKKSASTRKSGSAKYDFSVSTADRKRLNSVLLNLQKNLDNTMSAFEKTIAILSKW